MYQFIKKPTVQKKTCHGTSDKSQKKAVVHKPVPYTFASAQPVQCLMKKTGYDAKTFNQKARNTVFLYAEFNGTPVGKNGVFQTTTKKHAEENLIAFLENEMGQSLDGGKLFVILSTTPCSSLFGTTNKGEGCCEKLDKFITKYHIQFRLIAHHYYNPNMGYTLSDLDQSMWDFVQESFEGVDSKHGVGTFSSLGAMYAYFPEAEISKEYNGNDIIQLSMSKLKKCTGV